jgi:ADP-heptose:LPS heptosyltransferase
LRPTKESFEKVKSPYLVADAARVQELRQLVRRPGKRICGVSWSSKREEIGQGKSISLAQMLEPLASDALHFVNLQYGDTAEERAALLRERGIEVQSVDQVDNFNDIDGLAALIEACDVVVTTSNTTVHLAGALGKDTLLLLPRGRSRLWYWGHDQIRSIWYPPVRIYAQEKIGDWQSPLTEIKHYLTTINGP